MKAYSFMPEASFKLGYTLIYTAGRLSMVYLELPF
jgi:hypothetical protein